MGPLSHDLSGEPPRTGPEASPLPSDESLIRSESIYGRLPLLPEEREYGTRGAHATCFAYAVATWCFLIGGYVAQYLGAVRGMICLVTGSVIGVFLAVMGPALAGQRHGLETVDVTKPAFGQRGSRLLLLFYLINLIGWAGLILVMFGNGLRNILIGFGYEPGGWVVGAGVLLGMSLCFLLVTRGIHLMNITNAYVGPGLMLMTVGLLVLLLKNHGWQEIVEAKPLNPFDKPWLNYMIVMEMSIAAGISWWAGVGFLSRNTKTQRGAIYPELIQLGLGMGLVCSVALFSSLVVRSMDPTEWLIPIAGPFVGVLALIFVAVANISSSSISLFAAGLGLRHLRVFRIRPWWHLVLWALVPCLPFVFWPNELYGMGGNFLAYNGTLYAPVVGILFADYVFIRKQRLNLAAIFDDDPKAEYYYTKGFHWPALTCLLIGQLIYFSLLDPLTYESSPAFLYLTASLPACVGPAVIYVIWLKLLPLERVWAPGEGGAEPRVSQPNI